MKVDNNNIGKNGSGCSDPTAYAAIKKVAFSGRLKNRNRDKDVADMMSVIKRILDIMDFKLECRLVLIDKKTGKRYE